MRTAGVCFGQACLTAGDTGAARQALTRALEEAERNCDSWDRMVALTILRGSRVAHTTSRRSAQTVSGGRRDRNRGISAGSGEYPVAARSFRRVTTESSDVLVAQGDGPGALASYRKGLAIREGLAARDPANTEWQRDRSVSHDQIGDVLVAQGDGPGALASYRKGLAIGEGLAARDPANVQWQIDVAVSCAKLGTHTMAWRPDDTMHVSTAWFADSARVERK